ncbi:FAD-dependent oxidoreductase [Variovorax ureilyticus]|uniref:FAD-dependent oxidoreductase n=1 Tax=Variovorax ureilyticus TaxID=1836198 RepID=UPI003D664F69
MVEEYAFDAVKLAEWTSEKLKECGVEIFLDSCVKSATLGPAGWQVECDGEFGGPAISRYVFNCTYSGLKQIDGTKNAIGVALKHEITEMALMKMPVALKDLGITMMDGPFFSTMPFPSRNLHTLSHVRYTPHVHWLDSPGINPYHRLREYPRETRVDRMLRDVRRYIPAICDAAYVDSLFEVKTVLIKNEGDDGRPIFFERCGSTAGYYSVLGGKIDNIYDVLARLEAEQFEI